MGQYHVIVNLDRREYLRPRFAKLSEVTAGAYVLAPLAYLLAGQAGDGGRGTGDVPAGDAELAREMIGAWAGDRIALCGDYATPDDPTGWDHGLGCSVYRACMDGHYDDITHAALCMAHGSLD